MSQTSLDSNRTNSGEQIGGVLLCGGKSSRMGQPKALLPFANRTMVEHILGTLQQVVAPIVVVASVEQVEARLLPALDGATIVTDRFPERGPLEGIRVGLGEIANRCDAAFVTSCDAPLLHPEFIRHLIASMEDYDIVVPVDGRFAHPLAAIYRTSLVPRIDRLLQQDQRRPRSLIDAVRSRKIDVEQLRAIDGELDSLLNINHPEEYEQIVRRYSSNGPTPDDRPTDK